MEEINTNILNKYFINNFKNSKFYKLDFGLEEFRKEDDLHMIIFLAALSGFNAIDISTKSEFINLAFDAINQAKQKLNKFNINLNVETLLFASFGMNLFSNLDNSQILKKLEGFKNLNVDVIDIHFNDIDFLNNIKNFDIICEFFKDKMFSVNLSRKKLSNVHMIDLLEKCYTYKKNNFIIEVEGMIIDENKFSHNLQTISTADIINKQFKEKSFKFKKIPIILGNCNSLEIEKLAQECNVPFNGISINYQYINNLLKKKSYLCSDEEINDLINEIKSNLFNYY